MGQKHSRTKIICHGHKCPDRKACHLYTTKRVKGDDEKGNNSIECEVKKYYESKVR